MRVAFFSMLVLCLGEAIGGPAYKRHALSNGRTYLDHPSAKASILSEFSDSDDVTIAIDHSGDAWEGRYYHFSGIDTDTGLPEEFTVHIVDGIVDSDFPDAFSIPAPSIPANTTDLILRPQFFICDWYYTCVRAAVYAASISANQANIVKNAINERLRANNNALMHRLVDGLIVNFSVAIASGITVWYITNSIQGTPDKAAPADVCVANDDWTERISQIQADIEEIKKAIQNGDSRPRTFVHVSVDHEQGIDGHAVAHGVKATQTSSDFHPRSC